MERLILREVELEGSVIEKLHVLLDDNCNVIVLPLLWTIHLANTYSVFGWKKRGSFYQTTSNFYSRTPIHVEKIFDMQAVSENTIENYIGHFFQFLKYINEIHKSEKTPSVHNTELINSRFLNHYLNSVLPERLNSATSLTAHQSAISAYFAFLYELEIKNFMPSIIYRKTNQFIAEKDNRQKKINYVTKSERSALLRACNNERDKLIIRMGFEVGLRAEENTGLILGVHKAKSMQHDGLLHLFDELAFSTSKHTFSYTLNGKYTKGGKTRIIYFSRELLTAMKHYYCNERLQVLQHSSLACNTLFLRQDRSGLGLPICAGHASNVFNELRNRCKYINPALSYHDLRHTFATELYHAEYTVLPQDYSYIANDDVIRISKDKSAIRVLYRAASPNNGILITEQCNHYCLMCSQPPKAIDDSWLLSEATALIPMIPKYTREVIFTGGEPTLFGEGFLDILRLTKSYLPHTAIHILSNGRTFKDEAFAQSYASIDHQDMMVGIPIYSDDPAQHDYIVQAKGAFDETILGVLNLKKLNQKVEIRVVIHKQSIGRLKQLCEFIGRNLLFVDHVALMGLEMMGFTRANLDALWIDPYDYKDTLSEAVQILSKYGMNVSVYNHQLCLVNNDVLPFYKKSISDWKNEFVDECKSCSKARECGGLFSSGVQHGYSKHLTPF